MNGLLLDTQLLVWLAERPKLLPQKVYELVQDPENDVYFSLVGIWEVSIKFALGRSDFTTDPRDLRESLLRQGFRELEILPEHVIAVSRLARIHRDPFDRLLVAQAQVEGLILMTTDKTLAKYGDWVKRY